MALTVSLTQVSAQVLSNQPTYFTVTVSNGGSSSLTLQSLQITEASGTNARVGSPTWMTPNTTVGTGYPVIAAGASSSWSFPVVFNSPATQGPSPQHAPGGASPSNQAVQPNASFVLRAQILDSSNAVASAQLQVSSLASLQNDPAPQGGALWLNEGANLVNLLTL